MAKVVIEPNTDTLAEKAATILEQAINDISAIQETVVIAVPGGRSVGAIFSELVRRDSIDWSKVHIFIVDERLRGLDDPESNFYLISEKLTSPLLLKGLSEDAIHPFIYEPDQADKGAIEYEKQLIKLGGKYDILLLSSGEDGHVAGLFPNHESVKNNNDYFVTFNTSPKPPAERISSTANLLARSTHALVVFAGENKAQAYQNYINASLTMIECPAKVIDMCEHSYVLTTHG